MRRSTPADACLTKRRAVRCGRSCRPWRRSCATGPDSVLEHLFQIVETAAINALEELGNAGVTLGLRRIVGRVLALAAPAPDHLCRARRPRSHRNRGHISCERQRGFDDLVAIGMMRRVEREQPFGECRAVLDGEFSHRTDLAVASGYQLVVPAP